MEPLFFNFIFRFTLEIIQKIIPNVIIIIYLNNIYVLTPTPNILNKITGILKNNFFIFNRFKSTEKNINDLKTNGLKIFGYFIGLTEL